MKGFFFALALMMIAPGGSHAQADDRCYPAADLEIVARTTVRE